MRFGMRICNLKIGHDDLTNGKLATQKNGGEKNSKSHDAKSLLFFNAQPCHKKAWAEITNKNNPINSKSQ